MVSYQILCEDRRFIFKSIYCRRLKNDFQNWFFFPHEKLRLILIIFYHCVSKILAIIHKVKRALTFLTNNSKLHDINST